MNAGRWCCSFRTSALRSPRPTPSKDTHLCQAPPDTGNRLFPLGQDLGEADQAAEMSSPRAE